MMGRDHKLINGTRHYITKYRLARLIDDNNDINIIIEPDIATTENNSENVTVVAESNVQEDPSNQNVLCGTCPDIPYNIATHFCVQCKENICKDCKHGQGIFRATRDHIISSL